MEELFAGNSYFRNKQREKLNRLTAEEVKSFRRVGCPDFQATLFGSYAVPLPPNLRPRRRTTSANKLELGPLGTDYHMNLRKTVRSQTRTTLMQKEKHSAWKEQELGATGSKGRSEALAKATIDHLSLLNRALLRRGSEPRGILQLQASHLPVLQRQKSKRSRVLADYDSFYRAEFVQVRQQGRGGRRAEKPFLSGWQHDPPDLFS